jgi:hypothetical protein
MNLSYRIELIGYGAAFLRQQERGIGLGGNNII